MTQLTVLAAALAAVSQQQAQVQPEPAVAARLVIAPAPIARRVATADAVVTGKVVSIDDKTVNAVRFPGDTGTGEYKVAVVKIDDPILNARGLTHVRVGFQNVQVGPGAGPIRPGRPRPVTLQKDQEVLLFLQSRPDVDFYTAPAYFDVVDKNAPTYAADLAEAKRCGSLLAEADKNLKSGNAEDRYLTAAMLLSRYRNPGFRNPNEAKQEPISAERSKALLTILAEADWAPQPGRNLLYLNPQNIFQSLGLTEADGWKPPTNFNTFQDEARKWLREHKDTYRIKQYVQPKPGEKQ